MAESTSCLLSIDFPLLSPMKQQPPILVSTLQSSLPRSEVWGLHKFWSIIQAEVNRLLGILFTWNGLVLLPLFLHLHLEHGYETTLFKITSSLDPIRCFHLSLSATIDRDDASFSLETLFLFIYFFLLSGNLSYPDFLVISLVIPLILHSAFFRPSWPLHFLILQPSSIYSLFCYYFIPMVLNAIYILRIHWSLNSCI